MLTRPVPADLDVPELRDYRRINAEVTQLLDAGETLIHLDGVEGQRLLLLGLRGHWRALIEVRGWAGPEFAAEVESPHLRIHCKGRVAEGAGRDFQSGMLVVEGEAGDAVAYGQSGGLIVVQGKAGHRAGLNLRGGVLALLGGAGRLTGERQSGGRILVRADALGPSASWGSRGGSLEQILPDGTHTDSDLANRVVDRSEWYGRGSPPGFRLVES